MLNNGSEIREIAKEVYDYIAPYCAEIQIAGSIRRGKTYANDVDIVCRPQGDGVYRALDDLVHTPAWNKWKYGKNEGLRWGSKLRGLGRAGYKVEIFFADEANYGYKLWLRTGPAEANRLIMGALISRPARWEFGEGDVTHKGNGKKLVVPDEKTLFYLLGFSFVQPHERSRDRYMDFFRKRGHAWGDPDRLGTVVEEKPPSQLSLF